MWDVWPLIEKMQQDEGFYPYSSEPEVGLFIYSLIRLVRAKNVLELGTFKGFVTICMASAVKDNGNGRVYTIDIKDYASVNIGRSGLASSVELIVGDDLEVLRDLRQSFDLVFADSVHDEEHVMREFELIKDKLTPHGIVVVHDSISSEGVSRAVERIKSLPGFDAVTFATPVIPGRELHNNLPSGLSLISRVSEFQKVGLFDRTKQRILGKIKKS